MKPSSIKHAWAGAEKCQHCSIKESVLFADLTQDDFHLLHLPISEIDLKTDSVLYEQTDINNFVYTIRSGCIKLVHHLANGSYRIVGLLRQGDLAGIEALNGSAYLQQAVAMQDTSVCKIPVKNIHQLNHKSSHLCKQLMARWQKGQSQSDIWLTDFTTGNAKQRVAKLLLYLANYESEGFFYLPSRDDIGALLAITTETASRIIAEFRRTEILFNHRYTAKINEVRLKHIIYMIENDPPPSTK